MEATTEDTSKPQCVQGGNDSKPWTDTTSLKHIHCKLKLLHQKGNLSKEEQWRKTRVICIYWNIKFTHMIDKPRKNT